MSNTTGFSQTMRARVTRELKQLSNDPPTGIAAWPVDDRLDAAVAQIVGPEDSPYHNGVFRLSITFPLRYPFEPPAVQFRTKVYHPNIDLQGRICLDSLKMPPAGGWQPSLNLPQVLCQIRLLLAHPNGDDPLMPDVNQVYLHDRPGFEHTARKWTAQYAVAAIPEQCSSSSSSRSENERLSVATNSEVVVETDMGVPREEATLNTTRMHEGSVEERVKRKKKDDPLSGDDSDNEDEDSSSGDDSYADDSDNDDEPDQASTSRGGQNTNTKRQRTE
jgi:ubiquitin-conjugating enzyme E2 T